MDQQILKTWEPIHRTLHSTQVLKVVKGKILLEAPNCPEGRYLTAGKSMTIHATNKVSIHAVEPSTIQWRSTEV